MYTTQRNPAMAGRKRALAACLAILCLLCVPLYAFAHSGRTDSSGGHRDNKNASGLGSYHYHCGGHPPHLHTGGTCPYGAGGSTPRTSTTRKPTPTATRVKKITVSPVAEPLPVGERLQLTATVTPTGAADKTVTWSSSDTAIALVDAMGGVTAVAPGIVTITATAADGSDTRTRVKLTIVIPCETLAITGETQLSAGARTTLTAVWTPDQATDPGILWASADTAIASVSRKGIVTAKSVKSATTVLVTASTSDGSALTATHMLLILPKVKTVKVTLNDEAVTRLEATTGDTLALQARITPSDADTAVRWKSSNERVLTIDEQGLATCLAPGKATITVTTGNQKTAKLTVTVVAK